MTNGHEEDEQRGSPAWVWYAAYGSNMHLDRLRCYLAGGRPHGGSIELPGARDSGDPLRSLAVEIPGVLYFATESLTWTGGRAFYCPDAAGRTAARAHLLTAAQFADIVAQEMYRPPGADLDLREVLTAGRARLGPGRYETLVRVGTLHGQPMLTCTAPWHHTGVPWNPPSGAYLRHLAAGLAESHGWPVARIAVYLATRPGAAAAWSPEAVAEVIRTGL
ncbi:histone deacetylase [Nocardia shimofusensis]|uniref:histone deacetylase n=1 Tax=Nocardia shimofusensis TaxID=228596 RepID=UPI000ADAD14F|nr:histone deacetylase [Nocardia shimofusensis]